MKIHQFIFVALALIPSLLKAQTDTTDLFGLLGNSDETNYTTATFKTTRLMNGHSIENQAAGVLDFRINHRFGNLNGYTKVWTSDSEQVLKRLKKDDVFLVLSCGKAKNIVGSVIKILTSDGLIGYTAIYDRDPNYKLFMVSPPEDGNFEM